jgi:uncharacterized membrane protein
MPEACACAAATCAALIFGAGVALVGQMYHLPADWPAGSLLVGCGALAVAALLRSDGALLTAFACMGAWFAGLTTDGAGVICWRIPACCPKPMKTRSTLAISLACV